MYYNIFFCPFIANKILMAIDTEMGYFFVRHFLCSKTLKTCK